MTSGTFDMHTNSNLHNNGNNLAQIIQNISNVKGAATGQRNALNRESINKSCAPQNENIMLYLTNSNIQSIEPDSTRSIEFQGPRIVGNATTLR